MISLTLLKKIWDLKKILHELKLISDEQISKF